MNTVGGGGGGGGKCRQALVRLSRRLHVQSVFHAT